MKHKQAWCLAAIALLLAAGGGQAFRADQAAVMPPRGAPLLLDLSAQGVQIYTCESKDNVFAWTFTGPEATLSDREKHPAGQHFAGPTWTATDGSSVVGEMIAKADAPEATAIPWLLLRAKSHAGSGVLSTAAYIRRSDTKGGVAPATGCDAAHAAQQQRVPYTATYQFFGAAK